MSRLREKEKADDVTEYGIAHHQSMGFLFCSEDTILVRKTDIKKICPGDIVLFKRSKRIIAHRCVACFKGNDKKYLRTKGDNVSFVDKLDVTEEIMLGKIVQIKRGDRLINLETLLSGIISRYVAYLSFSQAGITARLRRSNNGPKKKDYLFIFYKVLINLAQKLIQ